MTVTHRNTTVPAMLLTAGDTIIDADLGPVFVVTAADRTVAGPIALDVHLVRLADDMPAYTRFTDLTRPVRIRRAV